MHLNAIPPAARRNAGLVGLLIALSSPLLATGANSAAPGDFGPPRGAPIRAVLTSPPNVPPPLARNYPAKVIVELSR